MRSLNLAELEEYQRRQRQLRWRNLGLLSGLALVLVGLWFWAGSGLSPAQARLWRSVREAQNLLWQWRQTLVSPDYDPSADRWQTGLIGLEWSPWSTTLGQLEAKRTACDPRWALVVDRWMDQLGLGPGDTVAVLSSSSFPGLILNTLMALEARRIQPLLVVSLGASTWGANDPAAPWFAMAEQLHRGGLLRTRARACTIGGGGETGGGLSPQVRQAMKDLAEGAGVPLVELDSLEAMIAWKMELIDSAGAKAVISIGGSHGNMGDGPEVLALPPGLLEPGRTDGGDGVIGRALRAGYPVIHLLNLRGLAAAEGVPFDGPPRPFFRGSRAPKAALLAWGLFAVVMAGFQRWRVDR